MTEFDDLEATELTVPDTFTAQYHTRSGNEQTDMSRAMTEGFGKLWAFMQEKSLTCAGPPRAVYTSWGPEGTEFTLAFPVVATSVAVEEGGACGAGMLAGGKALRFTHKGAYSGLMNTYGRITEWMKSNGMIEDETGWSKYMPMWEEYLNDPETTKEEDLLTHIYVPL
jgi:effector-binding domain-containing protein